MQSEWIIENGKNQMRDHTSNFTARMPQPPTQTQVNVPHYTQPTPLEPKWAPAPFVDVNRSFSLQFLCESPITIQKMY